MYSSGINGIKRNKLRSRIILALLAAFLLALGVAVFEASSVMAALSCVNDTAGANDEPG